MVDENRAEIILKNNVPRYILMEFTQMEEEYEKRGYGGTLWCEQVFKRIKNQSCKRSNVIGKSGIGIHHGKDGQSIRNIRAWILQMV